MKKLLFSIILSIFSILCVAQNSLDREKLVDSLSRDYRFDKVIELLQNAEDLNGKEKLLLAQAQYRTGKFFDALESYQDLYAKDSSYSFLLQQARIYDKLSQKDTALYLYYELAESVGDNAYYWKIAAASAEKLGRMDIALKCYFQSYELDQNDVETVYEYTGLLIKLESYKNADSILQKAILSYPRSIPLKRQRLVTLYRLKKYDLVVDLSEELFSLNDSNLLNQKIAGLANYHSKEYNRSIALLENVIEVDKESDFLHYYLGLAYRESGDAEKASYYLERSIDLAVSDNLPNYYTQLAVSYEEAGQTSKAIQAYQIAYKKTKDKVLLYHLARNYDILYKDKKVAMSYYQKYLDEKDTANEYLMNYSKHRIQELKAAVHFEKDTL